ncbi:MAG: hypothetical protein JWM98_998, partial [Thermoleophilia bacterium]|nr:hypothetical protein [Thermoleophilia bacterium]
MRVAMDFRVQRNRPSRVIVVVALLVGVLALPVSSAAAGAHDTRSDAQLAVLATQLEAETQALGESLLVGDERRDDLANERAVAREQLGQWLAQAYVSNSTGGDVVTQLFVSGSLAEAADRIRVAAIIADHHARLDRTLDEAEGRLDVEQLDRARTVTRLTAAQAELVQVHEEQERRAEARA